MLEIVVASSNPGKIAEVMDILAPLPVKLITPDRLERPPSVEETGESYLENALIKAQAFVGAIDKAALADDSGIEIDALDGDPGVRSARFAGPGASDDDNNAHMASLLSGVPTEKRTARYRCVAVVVFPDGRIAAGVGSCEGRIGLEPRGAGGFGYDPWFVPDGESRTMAELTPKEKHAISHRGRALRGLADQLRRMIGPSE